MKTAMTVYKYPLRFDTAEGDWPTIEMPESAKILTVQVQDEVPHIWALVDPKSPMRKRRFRIAGTGHPIELEVPDNHNAGLLELIFKARPQYLYIGTVQLSGGQLVFHIFEHLVQPAEKKEDGPKVVYEDKTQPKSRPLGAFASTFTSSVVVYSEDELREMAAWTMREMIRHFRNGVEMGSACTMVMNELDDIITKNRP